MITTVTLSPCIDKTTVLASFDPDKVNRAESSRLDAGGKGVNVSLALASLGAPTRAVGLMFEQGGVIVDTLRAAEVDTDFIECAGQIRTNMKIFVRDTGRTIEINEQNPEVSGDVVRKIVGKCETLAKDVNNDVFVLSGSIPPAVPSDIYSQMAGAIKSVNPRAKIILDTVGEPLLKGLEAGPYMIKPNVEELERSFGVRLEDNADISVLCRDIISKYGVGMVLVSKGADGAIAVTETETVSIPALKITPKSAQGAGDAMVAGACLAIERGMSLKDIVRYGTCSAAGAVEKEGTAFCSKPRFDELLAMMP